MPETSREIGMRLARHAPAGRPMPLAALVARDPSRFPPIWPDLTTQLFHSGTAALAMALRLALDTLPAGPQRRIAVPAYGCPNLVAAALWAGGTPAYYDLSPDTLAPETETVKALLDTGENVVLHVDAFGADTCPANLDGATSSRLVNDLAQSFAPYSSQWRPRAPYSVLSLGRAKPLSLTFGGVLLAAIDTEPTPSFAGQGPHQTAVPHWQLALRAALYALSLNPGVFGLLARIPALGIGQTRFAPLTDVERLPESWRRTVTAAVTSVRQSLGTFCAQTAAMLRLAQESGARVPRSAALAESRSPLWRVPVVCPTPEAAKMLAAEGAHLGVSRLYGKSLPQIVGMPAEEAAEHWPNAVWIAERLITLPTHGRLGSGEENDLRTMLRHLAA